MKSPFKRQQADDLTTLKIIMDALISVLVKKKVLRREDIQRQIIINAGQDPDDQPKE